MFCPLIRKLQAFEILKWTKESQWTKQRTSNFTREIQLIFSLQWKYSFLYFHSCEIQLLFKYALYLINIFLYFITLYIINRSIIFKSLLEERRESCSAALVNMGTLHRYNFDKYTENMLYRTRSVRYNVHDCTRAFGKFLAWAFISVTDLQTLSCLVSF